MSAAPHSAIAIAQPTPNVATGARPASRWLDALGIGLSAACMVHCLAMPALIVVLPQVSAAAGIDAWFHTVLAIVLPLIAAAALVRGYFLHRAAMALVLGGLGLGFVWMALAIPGCASCEGAEHAAHAHAAPMLLGLPAHNVVTTIGSVLLIAGHAINWRACRTGSCGSTCHEAHD